MPFPRLPLARSVRAGLGGGVLACLLAVAGGCESRSWLDPSEMAGARTNTRNPLPKEILTSLDPALEQSADEFADATDVTPEDLRAAAGDYTISRSDLLSISISDLQGPGTETVIRKRVSESGNISLPWVGQVKATGLTEGELEETIVEAYGPNGANQIQRAQVSVAVEEARGRAFSIAGAVGRGGLYPIPEADFRILDALVAAGDTTSPLNETAYVIRRLDEHARPTATGRPAAAPATGDPAGADAVTPPAGGPAADDLAPRSDAGRGAPERPVLLSAQAAPAGAEPEAGTLPEESPDDRIMNLDGRDLPASRPEADDFPPDAAAQPGATGAEMSPADASGAPATAGGQPAGGFEFNDMLPPPEVRVIRIPLDALRRGELQYNIVIQPRDTIWIPPLVVGEYYLGGHVGRPSAYSLTGRKITLKQAIIAAGMLDPLAIPQRTDLIRRVGPNREVFVRVDLDKIFAGTQPDIFLKPDDQLLVGTNAFAPFIAAARNAFRITYGAGFLYDRNFAAEQNNRFTTR